MLLEAVGQLLGNAKRDKGKPLGNAHHRVLESRQEMLK
jgi:hypothetical protein